MRTHPPRPTAHLPHTARLPRADVAKALYNSVATARAAVSAELRQRDCDLEAMHAQMAARADELLALRHQVRVLLSSRHRHSGCGAEQ